MVSAISDYLLHRQTECRLYTKMLEGLLEEFRMTQMEVNVLLFLANNPQYDTAGDIVQMRRFTKSHVSAAVKSLVQKGYLEASFHSGNLKTVHLTICPTASALVEQGKQIQLDFIGAVTRGIPEEEVAALFATMRKIHENAEEQFRKTERKRKKQDA